MFDVPMYKHNAFRFLEDILSKNPSEHPTIVLSQILNSELQPLVEFMYNGEVAIEQSRLQILLEAANILKIKGLWESGTNKEASKSIPEQETVLPQEKKYGKTHFYIHGLGP